MLAGRFTGVAKDAKIIPVKVASCAGAVSKLSMARGLDWIRADMAKFPSTQRGVVSISTYIPASEGAQTCETAVEGVMTNCRSAVEATINSVIAANIPVVVSANNQNSGSCATSPARMGYGNEANFPSTHRTITVGGTQAIAPNYVDQRWVTSGSVGSNHGPCVSIYAPAHNMRVAGWSGTTSYRPSANSGTSFSAPYVAGIIARLLSTPAYSKNSPHQLWLEVRNRAIGRNVQPADFDPGTTTNTWLAYMSALQ